MSSALIIVESPTKAKTIGRFLDNNYKVMSSYGHVRDLPKSKLGIDVDDDFKPQYQLIARAKPAVAELKQAVAKVDTIYLATDEDREGEAISWHLAQVLKLNADNCKRIVFHEITPEAIEQALKNPRAIDNNLVRAQEARRLLDRLYGYSVSPLLWQKIKVGLSAGRVQSVAIRILVERERERLGFNTAEYWDVLATFATLKLEEFTAQLVNLNNQPLALGKDFAGDTGLLKNHNPLWLKKVEAEQLVAELKNEPALVQSVESKPFVEKPLAPFITSTLQQESNRKLRYSARRTMQLAQDLYENGYITYMRTDSTLLSEQAITAARNWIKEQYGNEYLSPSARQYQTKVKNAQEAHEAIRPAGANFKPLDQVKIEVSDDTYRLYELIWKRTVASQMADCRGDRVTILVEMKSHQSATLTNTASDNSQNPKESKKTDRLPYRSGLNSTGSGVKNAIFRASGKAITFEGYRRAYVEGSDSPETDLAEQEKILPAVTAQEKLQTVKLEPKGHITQPPARLTEAALIKELETRGIGRPSTYASIIDTIERRDYAVKRGTTLIPTFTAFAVVNLMEKYLANLVDYNFTAHMEDELDEIAAGDLDDKTYLKEFYFGDNNNGLVQILSAVKDSIDPRTTSGVTIGEYEGKIVEVRIGRYGPFIKWNDLTAPLPPDIAPDDLTITRAVELIKQGSAGPKILGADPHSGLQVYAKVGRFGPYVQLGESLKADNKDKTAKPKMASLLKSMTPQTVTLEQALQLLSLPRPLGTNPKTNLEVTAANGRFGPYIKSGAETRSIPATADVLHITLGEALELLAQDKKSSRRGAEVIKELGKNSATDKTIKIMSGRYGMYVTDGETNATINQGLAADNITLEQAVELIKAREGVPKKRRTSRKKS
ncbi:MAG: type I DNA topoisomerase [Patescibacteria group bacterium]